jgi:hypothetical protein
MALSDRDNWWRPYTVDGESFTAHRYRSGRNVEIGGPDWSINSRYYHVLPDGELLVTARRGSVEELYRLDGKGGATLDTGAVSYGSLVIDGDKLYFTAGFCRSARSAGACRCRGQHRDDSPQVALTRRWQPDWIPPFEQVSFPLPGWR